MSSLPRSAVSDVFFGDVPHWLVSSRTTVSVFRRAGSADFAEYTGKVLLSFEAAGDGYIQDARFGGT